MKKVKKIPNCCSYNSPGFTYSQPFQTDAQMVLDLKLSYEHPPNRQHFFVRSDPDASCPKFTEKIFRSAKHEGIHSRSKSSCGIRRHVIREHALLCFQTEA